MKWSFVATTAMLLFATACGDSTDRLLTAPSGRPSRIIVVTSPTGATVNTDQEDYAPGQVVTIVGKGWTAGETVHLNLTENPVADGPHDWDVTADADGAFADTTFSPDTQHIGVTFTLSATGPLSGSAVASFTDGNVAAKTTGVSITVNWRFFGNSACTGSPTASGSFTADGTSPVTAHFAVAGESVELTAPASASGQLFSTWTSASNVATTTTVCVLGSNSVQNWLTTYVAAPSNAVPVVNAGADATINEGDTFSQSGSFTDPDANTWTATVDYGDGSGVQALPLSGKTFVLSHQYVDNGSYTITVTVNDGTASSSDQVTVTVNNVAPTATFGNNGPVNEGTAFQLSLTSPVDPSSADVTAGLHYAFDCGDGGGYGTAVSYATSSATSTKQCATTDNGSRSVKGKIFDKDGGATEYTGTLAVNNVAPTATFANNGPVNEGSSFQLSLTSPVDPSSADVAAGFHYAFDCGDGNGYGAALSYATSGTTSSVQCSTTDNGVRSVKAKIFDKDNGSTEYTSSVTVNNVAPTVTSIAVTPALLAVNTSVTGSAPFTDPGTADTHTAAWNWGDGSASVGSVTESSGSGTATGTHTYIAAGVYTVTVTITDDDGGAGSKIFQYVVVYDPSAGFVTGGGWINSPAGAYVANPSLSGKATFGFVSKYKKGQSIPDGDTEFQFQAAGFNFKSTSYEWLVIAGSKAQYKGSGMINGTGDYFFMLTAIDGSPDKFRIKVWDKTSLDVIYDNQVNALDTSDTADPTTALAGGSIQIHAK
jgi:hypothetical protein